MGWKAHVAVWAGVIVAVVAFILIVLASGAHCGGRGCVNRHPSPTASVSR